MDVEEIQQSLGATSNWFVPKEADLKVSGVLFVPGNQSSRSGLDDPDQTLAQGLEDPKNTRNPWFVGFFIWLLFWSDRPTRLKVSGGV